MTPATITAEEFARLLGVAPWTVYQSVRQGTCPVEPIRVGARRMVWSSARVAAMLGLDSLDDLLPAQAPVERDMSLRLVTPT